jgi:mRNA interferase MazF
MWRPEIDMDGTTSRVVIDQMTCIDPGRLGDLTGRLSAGELADLNRALTWMLGIL